MNTPLTHPEADLLEHWLLIKLSSEAADQLIADRISALAKQYNVCDFEIAATGPNTDTVICRDGTPCCEGCRHLGKSGCTVSAHGCRMWFCSTAWEQFPFAVQVEIHTLILQYEGQIYFRHDHYAIDKKHFSQWGKGLRFIFP